VISLEEPLGTAAQAMLRISGGRLRRDCGLTWLGTLSLFAARHVPRIVDAFIAWRVGRLVRAGALTISMAPKT
jgi:hypothetical protein